ncbi:MAG: energy-coupling factor transporter transmembrane protein EcfT [Anaerolineales bacterium]|nr:energy-coupling factor transporter transmembrane protein EcfT [Anaerolineales bacterium]
MADVGYINQDSFLHRLDARTKLILMLAILVVVLVFTDPIYVIAILFLVLGAWKLAKLPLNMVGDIFKYFTGIAVIIFVLQAFFYPGETNLLQISNPIPAIGFSGYITLQGVMYGLALVLRLVVIMTVAPLLVMTTPMSDLMLALVKFKVPYRFAFILTTAMSLFPSIQNRAELIQQAQLCRGVGDFESGNFFVRLRASASILTPLILGAFRDSQILDVAMSSRAFGAPIQRTFLLESHFRQADYIFLAGSCLSLVGAVILRIMHLGVV